ncbi:fluoroquinolone transporter permease [Allonocardiopsis opalescens]|uniref:Fluoroquinolone transport system permease protein n=1 Tax=Allonocardiopsis opalescens TaxID=1144618 RepID=A0A2T0Q2N3_9ACTN|nr:fluoroquinolone transporter permease [Allonocardiopsis opalescens]PRX97980.1 fluoroquinolone transport system permease protein [Allonocardiopsis opalescens]
MSALTATMRLELKLQRRYGFLYAAAFSGVLWLAVLLPIPSEYRDIAAPLVLFGDLTIVAFFFIAGSLFFEKGERTVFALVTTPLSFWEYLTAKLVTLTGLSVALSFAIVLPVHGLAFGAGLVLLGCLLMAPLMLLLSFVTAAPYAAISDWVVPSSFWIGLCSLPLLAYGGLWEHWSLYSVPTYGPLLLFGAAFGQLELSAGELVYAVVYPLLWMGVLLVLARRVFDRFIVAGEGA